MHQGEEQKLQFKEVDFVQIWLVSGLTPGARQEDIIKVDATRLDVSRAKAGLNLPSKQGERYHRCRDGSEFAEQCIPQ